MGMSAQCQIWTLGDIGKRCRIVSHYQNRYIIRYTGKSCFNFRVACLFVCQPDNEEFPRFVCHLTAIVLQNRYVPCGERMTNSLAVIVPVVIPEDGIDTEPCFQLTNDLRRGLGRYPPAAKELCVHEVTQHQDNVW